MTDILKQCADIFNEHTKYNYIFTIGKRNKNKFQINTKCLKEDFTHIIGLDHLTDIECFNTHKSKEKISNFEKIKHEVITMKTLQTQSDIFSMPIPATYNSQTKAEYTLTERITTLCDIEKHLDSAYKGKLFQWNLNKCNIYFPNGKRRYCKIKADYLLVIPSLINDDENIYYFMVQDSTKIQTQNIIQLKIHSAFPDCIKIENGQEKSLTILEEIKMNYKSKTTQTLYIHPSYQKEKDETDKKLITV